MTWTANQDFADAFIEYVQTEPAALMFHDKLRRDLLGRFPFAQWEIWALCAALEEGIFLDLSTSAPELSETNERELVWVLIQRLSLSEELALWTVRTLASGFRKTSSTALRSGPDIKPPPVPFLPDT